MTESHLCPRCGQEIPQNFPAGLCPRCLLQAGLESMPAGDPRVQATQASPRETSGGFVPPTIEELAAQLPQLEILELLGKGGMGAVYKARQKELDRIVAVKVLPPDVDQNQAFAERFTREAKAMAKLNHPNIVTIHDFGRTSQGLFFFVMEYVDGVNLRQALRSGHMSPREALAVVPQVCDALQFAHDEGIVHRDIKPENILLDKKGRVKIADFGLAKLLGHHAGDVSLTATQQVMGTLRYMAPEQMEGTKTVDHRADIYSLGVVFYELLTGELPVGRFAPPSKKVQIDVRLDEVVLRTLEEKPEQRYQHASDVKTAVENVTGHLVGVWPPIPVPAHPGEASTDELEQLVIEKYKTEGKIPAIRLYREKTGTSLSEAKNAVEAIARKHGISVQEISLGARALTAVALSLAALGAILGFALLPGYLGLSPIVTTPIIWVLVFATLVIPNTRLAYQHRGTPEGRRAGWLAGLWVFILIGFPLLDWFFGFLTEPESALNWLYKVTGITPGPHDADFFQILFLSLVLGTLIGLIVFLVRSLSQRKQALLAQTGKEPATSRTIPQGPVNTLPATIPPGLLPQLMVTAMAILIGGLTMAIGVALAVYAILTESPQSGQFWGWMGGAFGCFFGGGGGLIGAINSYRQLAGTGDLMTAIGWNWLDRLLAGYALLGSAAIVTAAAWSSIGREGRYALLLLGVIVVGQAALFWAFRSPYRRQGSADQQTHPDNQEMRS